MKSFRKLMMALGAICAITVSWDIHAQTAMQEAAKLGNGKGQSIYSDVTSKLPDSTTVPGYNGTDQKQKSYYQGGKGELVGPGVNRAGGCVSQGDAECTAVNLLQWGPSNRPTPTFSANDPLITGARSKLANAKGSLGSFGTIAGTTAGALSQTSTQCETKSIVKPATYESTVCDLTAQLENKSCNIDRVMKVDATYDYTCEKASQRKTVQTCNKTLSVTCSGATPLQSCPNGAQLVNGRCQTTTYPQEAAIVSGYMCPAGYSMTGWMRCEKNVTISPVNYTYCQYGGAINSSQCKFYSFGAESDDDWTNTPNYQPFLRIDVNVGRDLCRSLGGNWEAHRAAPSWCTYNYNSTSTCPTGYTMSGSSCVQTITVSAEISGYTCKPGGTLNANNTCTYILTTDSNPNVTYTCPVTGQLTATSAVNGITTYSCCVDAFQNACQGLEAKAQ